MELPRTTAENKAALANSGNGGRPAPQARTDDFEKAQDIARRYRCEFIDLRDFQLHHDLFKKIPVDLMFRYNFVPLEETQDGRLAIAIADPSQLMMIDEISLLLGKRIVTKVSTLKQISEILKKTEQSKRVLEDASEGFTLDVIREDEAVNDDGRHEPDHPARGHHDLHRAATQGKRYSHRDRRQLRGNQVPH